VPPKEDEDHNAGSSDEQMGDRCKGILGEIVGL
jgi:hypothetical protein